MSTKFQTAISKALNALVPMAPLSDVLAIKDIARRRHLRHLPAEISAWLAITTHIRHNHTDYDTLLNEGYDSDASRHFVLDDMNDVLRSWAATKFLDGDEDEAELIRKNRKMAPIDEIEEDERDDEPE